MTLGSCSCTALAPGLVVLEVSETHLHITAVSGFNMPMELVGPELLDFNEAQYTVKLLWKFLPSPSLPQDTGVRMMMHDNNF